MIATRGLNPKQQKAVEHGEGPLLIIAGPGSGKTHVIVQRIIHLLAEASHVPHGSPGLFDGRDVNPGPEEALNASIRPENILALTFTDKAAREMQRRVRAGLPGLHATPYISTFHAFCYDVLRKRHFDRTLLDKIDVWIFLRRRMEKLELEFYQKLAEPGAFLHSLNDFFSRCQDELIEPADFERYVDALDADFQALAPSLDAAERKLMQEDIQKKRELVRVFCNSLRLLEEAGCSSMGSLIPETVRLFERESELAESYHQRFRYVLVDEFQDTNYAQVELLKLLVKPPCNVTAVGDDDQAIYRFRGASHGAFRMFDEAFPGHETVFLDTNYRSTKRILRVAEVVVAKNDRYQAKPALRTDQGEGSAVRLLQAPDYRSEAIWVAEEVARLMQRGTPPGHIAVLYRAHSYRDLLVAELRARRIPFAIRGLSILSTVILRDLLAYLNVIHSPHDNISLTRVLLEPRWNFPEALALEMRRQASRDHCSLYDVLDSWEKSRTQSLTPPCGTPKHENDPSPSHPLPLSPLPKGEGRAGGEWGEGSCPELSEQARLASTGWPDLKSLLIELHQFARNASMTELLAELIRRLGLSFPAHDPDAEYVETFRKFLEDWQKKSGSWKLSEFQEYFRYFLDAGGVIAAPEPEDAARAVQLMSVHAAKGLEFPVVFVLSVASRRFPHTEQSPVIEFPEALRKGPSPPANIHEQEERRLFYVALTRAKERLYISGVAKPGKKGSKFIDDVCSNAAVLARDIERIQVPEAPPESADVVSEQKGQAASCSVDPPQSGRSSRLAEPRSIKMTPHPLTPCPSPLSPEERGEGEGSGVRGPDRNSQASMFGEEPARPAVHPLVVDSANHLPSLEPGEKLQLSATAIEMYQACPMKFKLFHYLKVPTGAQPALTFGNLMHQCVRWYFEHRSKGQVTCDQVQKYFLESWRSSGFEDEYQENAYKKAGLEQLQAFVSSHEGEPTLPLGMEAHFALTLDDIVLEGRIDQINPLPDHSVELVDYKTGRPRSQKDADQSLQLSVYALAAREQMRLRPTRLTFYNLSNNEPVSSVRTQKELELALQEIRAVAAQIRERLFAPRPGFVCKYCDYKLICPAHEQNL